MSGIKNKDGSINWSNVKVNPVIKGHWAVQIDTEPVKLNLTPVCEALIAEIEKYKQLTIESQDWYKGYKDSPAKWYRSEGVIQACNHFLNFYEEF